MVDVTHLTDAVIAELVYEQYEKRREHEQPRAYLGASIIGKECARALWYDFRWTTDVRFSGRMLRLFDTGHHAEPRFIKDLRDIGCTVYATDPTTGHQFGFEDVDGHCRGHMDGAGQHVPNGGKQWHVLEFKTHNAKSFAELSKKGVKEAKPLHWCQMQMYMGWSEMESALYGAVNKDDDALYFERVKFDRAAFEALRDRARKIIYAAEPPLRLSDDPAHWQCKMCDHHALCHGLRSAKKNCRTCVHATPTRDGDGAWVCENSEREPIPFAHQLTGCGEHLHLPQLLAYATPLLAEPGWILYQHKNGGHFCVVTELGMPNIALLQSRGVPEGVPFYTSDEIAAAAADFIADATVDELRREFGGKITG